MKSGKFLSTVLVVLSLMLLASYLVPSAFAAQSCSGNACSGLSLSTSPPSPSVNGLVTISTTWTQPSGVDTSNNLWFVLVTTPSGVQYSCNSACVDTFTPSGTSGASITCTIPYGAAGSLSTSVTDGANSGCSGSQPVWEKTSSTYSSSQLSGLCEATSQPGETGTLVDGDTSQTGTYTVYACWIENPAENLANAVVSNTFTIGSSTTTTSTSTGTCAVGAVCSSTGSSSPVPEFPVGLLGLFLLVGVLVPALLLMRIKMPAKIGNT